MFKLNPLTTTVIVGGAVVGSVVLSVIAYKASECLRNRVVEQDKELSEAEKSAEKEVDDFLRWREKDASEKEMKAARSRRRTLLREKMQKAKSRKNLMKLREESLKMKKSQQLTCDAYDAWIQLGYYL